MPHEGYLRHADHQLFRAENHSLLPADLENFARVAYEVIVVLPAEKQIIDIYLAFAVERHVENMHAHTLLEEVHWESRWDSRPFLNPSKRHERSGVPAVLVQQYFPPYTLYCVYLLCQILVSGPLLQICLALDFQFVAAFPSCSAFVRYKFIECL